MKVINMQELSNFISMDKIILEVQHFRKCYNILHEKLLFKILCLKVLRDSITIKTFRVSPNLSIPKQQYFSCFSFPWFFGHFIYCSAIIFEFDDQVMFCNFMCLCHARLMINPELGMNDFLHISLSFGARKKQGSSSKICHCILVCYAVQM